MEPVIAFTCVFEVPEHKIKYEQIELSIFSKLSNLISSPLTLLIPEIIVSISFQISYLLI